MSRRRAPRAACLTGAGEALGDGNLRRTGCLVRVSVSSGSCTLSESREFHGTYTENQANGKKKVVSSMENQKVYKNKTTRAHGHSKFLGTSSGGCVRNEDRPQT